MSETQALLARISSLRQRLDDTRKLTQQTIQSTDALGLNWPGPGRPISTVPGKLHTDHQHDMELDRIVEPLTGPVIESGVQGPEVLTARSRRILEQARDMIARIRVLSSHFQPLLESASNSHNRLWSQLEYSHPMARLYRDTTAMIDTTLRMIPLFPASAIGQIHLCEGLESILNLAAGRLGIVEVGIQSHQEETQLLSTLIDIHLSLLQDKQLDGKKVYELADKILQEAQNGEPIRFPVNQTGQPEYHVANHCICTARVVARVVRLDEEFSNRRQDAVVAALLHDVGRLHLVSSGWNPAQSALSPNLDHCSAGLALVAHLDEEWNWLRDAIGSHHEYLDGTGNPEGRSAQGISPLTRLVAVCEGYVSVCLGNLETPPKDPRTALTHTLMLADQGKLDRRFAEHLLHLSFYPVGSAVEMSDGSLGMVIMTPERNRDWLSLSRPVVAVLVDRNGNAMARPSIVDLSQSMEQSIVRGLTPRERLEKLGLSHPEWVAA